MDPLTPISRKGNLSTIPLPLLSTQKKGKEDWVRMYIPNREEGRTSMAQNSCSSEIRPLLGLDGLRKTAQKGNVTKTEAYKVLD